MAEVSKGTIVNMECYEGFGAGNIVKLTIKRRFAIRSIGFNEMSLEGLEEG